MPQDATTDRPSPVPSQSNDQADHLVILVHGINTYAYWMGEVSSALKAHGFKVAETGYGRFSVLNFILPFGFLRKKAVKRVVDQIRIAIAEYRPAKTSVITHSFGTYIIASILEDEPTIVWNRIIFCGSVVRDDFRLDRWKHQFVSPIVNEVGSKDSYPALAESISSSYGSVGSRGFHHPLVQTRWHTGFRHSDFLTKEFCTKFWVPVLKNEMGPEGDRARPLPLVIRLLTRLPLRWTIPAVLVIAAIAVAPLATQMMMDRTDGEVPSAANYCSEIKEVIASTSDRFTPILGRRFGDNRIPTVPLAGWEDCIVFMETQFSNSRRYSCSFPGIADVASASRIGEKLAGDLTKQCLGANFAVDPGRDRDKVPYWRIVGRGTNATVTIRPTRSALSPQWELKIDVE